jgi:hypothetical protein
MVSKKLVVDGRSEGLEGKLAALQAELAAAKETPPTKTPAVVASRGFVARSEQTDREKEEAREWDRSALLKVADDDQQVKIYNDLARGPNNGGERPTRFGLGFGTADGASADAPSGPVKTIGTMRFVSSASVAPSPAESAPVAEIVETEWTGPHTTPEGNKYWYNSKTGKSEWTPPPGCAAAAEAAAPPPALPDSAADAAVTGPHTTSEGHQYWYNTRTGVSEWIQPSQPPQLQPHYALPAQPPHPQYAQPCAQTHYAQQPQYPPYYAQQQQQQQSVLPPTPAAKPGCTLSVSGIPPDFQDADVRELFGAHGAIIFLQLDRGSYSVGTGPKQGVVVFDGSVGAASAVKHLDGKTMRQHTLQVRIVGAADARPAAPPDLTSASQQGAPGAMRAGGAPALLQRYQPY